MVQWIFRRRVWISAALAVVAAGWGCGLYYLGEAPPDFYVFRASVERMPLPPRTSLVGRDSGFGLKVGNGNHCDYIARLLLRTDLSETELKGFYRRHPVPYVPGSYTRVPVEATVHTLDSYPYPYDLPERWQSYAEAENVFIVEYFDASEAGLDPRCN